MATDRDHVWTLHSAWKQRGADEYDRVRRARRWVGCSFLLRDDGRGYRKVWYRSGYLARDCRKLKAIDGRDVLICQNSDMHFGVSDEFLYLLDQNRADPNTRGPNQIFFSMLDSLGGCVALSDGHTIVGYIESVDVSTVRGSEKAAITVKARGGKQCFPKRFCWKNAFSTQSRGQRNTNRLLQPNRLPFDLYSMDRWCSLRRGRTILSQRPRTSYRNKVVR